MYDEFDRLVSLPFDKKVDRSIDLIRETGSSYVAYSGGISSAVVYDLVKKAMGEAVGIHANIAQDSDSCYIKIMDGRKVVFVNSSTALKNYIRYSGYPMVSIDFGKSYSKLFYVTHIEKSNFNPTAIRGFFKTDKEDDRIKFIGERWAWLIDEKMVEKLTAYIDEYGALERAFPKRRHDAEDAIGAFVEKWYSKFYRTREKNGLKDEKILINSECCESIRDRTISRAVKSIILYGARFDDNHGRRMTIRKNGLLFRKKAYPIGFWSASDVIRYASENGVSVPVDSCGINPGCVSCGIVFTRDPSSYYIANSDISARVKNMASVRNRYSDLSYGEAIEVVHRHLSRRKSGVRQGRLF